MFLVICVHSKYIIWYVLWVDGLWVDVKRKKTHSNGWSLAAVHLTACVSLSSSCPLMPTPGQREAGRVVTVRAAVNQTPSTCQQQPHRCSKIEWVSQSHTESGWLMAQLGDSSALINWVIDGKVLEIKRRERQNTKPCGEVEMWDILRGADWNAHSCLSCTEIPGFSQSSFENRVLSTGACGNSILLLQYAIQAQTLL